MRYLIIVILFFSLYGCAQEKYSLQGQSAFQRKINSEFKDASKSPLKDKDRMDFRGLDFFEIDSTYVVEATLERTPNSEWFNMKTTTERVSRERVFGILKFELNGEQFKLMIYQGEEMLQTEGFEDYLFLPFLDDTNGESTYGGGRYIDCRIPDGDKMIIDFNTAYNPYCAYNEKYSCPIVPRDNYLSVPIKAGVKSFDK